MSKLEQILPYTDPIMVERRAKQLYGRNVKIEYSTRKDKKYMIYDPNKNKWVHFGSMNPPMEDYTRHKDEERRRRFQIRNHMWASSPIYSASYNSYYLLW